MNVIDEDVDTVPGAAVAVRGLVKQYDLGDGRTLNALDHIDVDIAPAVVTALVGPSGSGKSMLLHLVGAIDSPTSGSITNRGREITKLRGKSLAAYRRTIGLIFQQFHLLPALTALDNVLAPVLPIKTSFDARARARELLQVVGLEGRERALPARLSGGQQQRVAIARALINNPSLILADEPTGNLDSQTAGDIMDLLIQLQESRGTTIVLATHDREIADRCHEMVRIRDGKRSAG